MNTKYEKPSFTEAIVADLRVEPRPDDDADDAVEVPALTPPLSGVFTKRQEFAASGDLPLPTFAAELQVVPKPLANLLVQFHEVLRGTHADDLPPTPQAIQRAYLLLRDASHRLPDAGDLYRDGDGGLRVEWEQGARRLSLVVHASEEREDYLYWQENDRYFIDTPVTVASFMQWLQWLQGSNE